MLENLKVNQEVVKILNVVSLVLRYCKLKKTLKGLETIFVAYFLNIFLQKLKFTCIAV